MTTWLKACALPTKLRQLCIFLLNSLSTRILIWNLEFEVQPYIIQCLFQLRYVTETTTACF